MNANETNLNPSRNVYNGNNYRHNTAFNTEPWFTPTINLKGSQMTSVNTCHHEKFTD